MPKREEGYVLWYNIDGYGVIESRRKKVFFHLDSSPKYHEPKAGDKVSFKKILDKTKARKFKAVEITLEGAKKPKSEKKKKKGLPKRSLEQKLGLYG